MTTIDFITEVADETVQGKFLKTCVNAHLQTNLSILNLLSSFDISVKKLYRRENGQTHFMWYRERPLDLSCWERRYDRKRRQKAVGRPQ